MTSPHERFKPSIHILPNPSKITSTGSHLTAPSLTLSSKSRINPRHFYSVNPPRCSPDFVLSNQQRISENGRHPHPGDLNPLSLKDQCTFLDYSNGSKQSVDLNVDKVQNETYLQTSKAIRNTSKNTFTQNMLLSKAEHSGKCSIFKSLKQYYLSHI